MYTAEKDNLVYTISEVEKGLYVAKGFDIFDENHEKIEQGTRKINAAEYKDALDKIAELEAKVLELSKKNNKKGDKADKEDKGE